MKILLIEDNHIIANQVGEFLAAHQWQIDFAHNAQLGIQLALAHIYDVILLDLNLPDGDGLMVCDEIKTNAEVTPPILMLTARDSFEDKAAGFHCGADDYLTKPFDLRELVLRCNVLARRQSLHQPKIVTLGELTLNTKTKTATRQGIALELTSIGFRILELLIQCYPEPASRTYLTHQLWGEDPPESDALRSHIYALRKALDRSFATPMLKTVMHVGFTLELPHALN